MTKDIKDYVNQCYHCSEYRSAQRRELLKATPMPDNPWERIGADLFVFDGQNYLVIMDYYSRFPEILHLQDTTSNTVIGKIKSVYARWGIPFVLVTDNGPQFRSEQFKQFCENYGFTHITSSPMFPQSNGDAESAVAIAKKILRQKDPYLALMSYRSTPNTATRSVPPCL